MSRAELIPELFKMESKTRVVPGTEIESTVGFEINSVVGSRMLTGFVTISSSYSTFTVHYFFFQPYLPNILDSWTQVIYL
jgi:hypothetical protein